MVSRQETARPLLTPGEVMQLPPDDELVLVSGCHPIRAKKARYYEDKELKARILPPPKLSRQGILPSRDSMSPPREDDWAAAIADPPVPLTDDANAGIRREPELPEHENIAPERDRAANEFEPPEDEADDDAPRLRTFQSSARSLARQATLDPTDDMGM
jgi:type IV secretion system protein VirD4